MKGTEQFKIVIQNHLNSLSEKDQLFAKTLKKENKNIDDCINYILNQVQKSGCNGFADEEIYQMAVHYYDEDDIIVGKPINAKVVVNHTDFKGKKVPTQQKAKTEKAKPVEKKPKVVKVPTAQVSLFDFPGV